MINIIIWIVSVALPIDKGGGLVERLIRMETLLENHLQWHGSVEKYFLYPILAGIMLILVKEAILIWSKFSKNNKP